MAVSSGGACVDDSAGRQWGSSWGLTLVVSPRSPCRSSSTSGCPSSIGASPERSGRAVATSQASACTGASALRCRSRSSVPDARPLCSWILALHGASRWPCWRCRPWVGSPPRRCRRWSRARARADPPLGATAIAFAATNAVAEELPWRGLFASVFPDSRLLGWIYPAVGFGRWHLAPQQIHPAPRPLAFCAAASVLGLLNSWTARRLGGIGSTTVSHALADATGLRSFARILGREGSIRTAQQQSSQARRLHQ